MYYIGIFFFVCIVLFTLYLFIFGKSKFLKIIEKSVKKFLKEGNNENILGNQKIEISKGYIINEFKDGITKVKVSTIEKIPKQTNIPIAIKTKQINILIQIDIVQIDVIQLHIRLPCSDRRTDLDSSAIEYIYNIYSIIFNKKIIYLISNVYVF